MDIISSLKRGIISKSASQTQEIAQQLAAVIPQDHVLTLSGDLGTGKTTFVQGLACHWGITTPITSPTYAIFNIYNGKRNLIHLDAYRLDGPNAIEDLMLEEFLAPPWCLAIEWPEKIPDTLGYPSWAIDFEQTKAKERHLKLIDD